MRKRGFTLIEVLTALGIIGFLVLGSTALLQTGLKGFRRTTTDADISSKNAQAVRRIIENLRGARSVTISSGGNRIDYVMPKMSTVVDPDTGEREILVPMQNDGVARAYVVDFSKRTVTDTVTNRVVLRYVSPVDPDPKSTQYKQPYVPFVLTTAGSSKAVTVNLITRERLVNEDRYARYKTTIIVHNAK